MTNEELQALGALIEAKLQPVNERMDTLSACYESTRARIGEINASIYTFNSRMGVMTARMDKMDASMNAQFAKVDERFSEVNEKLEELKFEMDTVYAWVDRMDLDVKDLKDTR